MDENQIQTFVTVAKEKNFTQAANILFISQPTVSKRIRTLEDELDCELFIRTEKTIELSTHGEKFLPYAVQALEKLTWVSSPISNPLKNCNRFHCFRSNTLWSLIKNWLTRINRFNFKIFLAILSLNTAKVIFGLQ